MSGLKNTFLQQMDLKVVSLNKKTQDLRDTSDLSASSRVHWRLIRDGLSGRVKNHIIFHIFLQNIKKWGATQDFCSVVLKGEKTDLGRIFPWLSKLSNQHIHLRSEQQFFFKVSLMHLKLSSFFQALTFDALIERAIVSLYHQVQPSVSLNYQSHLHD